MDNSGVDWFSVDYVKFTDAMLKTARVRVIGLNNGTFAMVWVQNRDHTWWNVVNEVPVEPVADAVIELSGFLDDQYFVEWWDTYEGELVRQQTVTVSGGELRLDLDSLERDIALKVLRQG